MRVLLWLLAALLAACASPPLQRGETPPPGAAIRSFSLEARFAVSGENERHSGRLSWRHSADGDSLRLVSPFGQTVAEIDVRPGLATLLTADRKTFAAADAQQLTQDALGYALPIARLSSWVLARPDGSGRVVVDDRGRALSIDEDGWHIEYEYADESPGALPARLTATRAGGPELRLRIEEWNVE